MKILYAILAFIGFPVGIYLLYTKMVKPRLSAGTAAPAVSPDVPAVADAPSVRPSAVELNRQWLITTYPQFTDKLTAMAPANIEFVTFYFMTYPTAELQASAPPYFQQQITWCLA